MPGRPNNPNPIQQYHYDQQLSQQTLQAAANYPVARPHHLNSAADLINETMIKPLIRDQMIQALEMTNMVLPFLPVANSNQIMQQNERYIQSIAPPWRKPINYGPQPQQMLRHPDTGQPLYNTLPPMVTAQPAPVAQPAPTAAAQMFPLLYGRPTPAAAPAAQPQQLPQGGSEFMKTKAYLDNKDKPFEQQMRWDQTAKNGKGAYVQIGTLIRQGKLDPHTGKSLTAATTLDYHLSDF